MKILTLIAVFFGMFFGASDLDSDERSAATKEQLIASADYLSAEEKAMIWEINLVRTEPATYIPFIEEELIALIADSVHLSSIVSESIRKRVSYENGQEKVQIDTLYQNYFDNRVQAIRELLIELGTAVSLPGLIPHKPLHTAAVKHADEQSTRNYIDHLGLDGSWPYDRQYKEANYLLDGNENIARAKGTPREVIIQLLIDSGVPHRGHRKNILNPDWSYVNCYNVRELDQNEVKWWIQEFAY